MTAAGGAPASSSPGLRSRPCAAPTPSSWNQLPLMSWPCTGSIQSNARTVRDIITELRATRVPERSGRAQDKESEDAFEKLRRDGYM